MTFKPFLIGGAGLIALQLLTVHAASVIPVDPPTGWSVSESFGTHYRLGYDTREKAYFIENIGPIQPVGQDVNAETSPSTGPHRVPYSDSGLRPSDLWAASLLQSVESGPYRKHLMKFEAEIKSADLKGHIDLLLRETSPDRSLTSSTHSDPAETWMHPQGKAEWQPFSIEFWDDQDLSVLTFGFLVQGEGRVLIRNVKLTDEGIAPPPPDRPKTPEMFGNPEATEHPINVEMRR